MKRYPSSPKARQRAGLPPEALYRDIHPDREPVALYDDGGNVALCCDLDTVLMDFARRVARKQGITMPALVIRFLQDKMDDMQRGY